MRFLVGGLARSGTTWFAETLASAPGFQYIHEPDTLTTDPFAWIGTRGIKFQEPIPPGTRMPNYQLMWDVAYSGGWRGAAPLLRRLALNRKLPKVVNIASSTTLARIARRRSGVTGHGLRERPGRAPISRRSTPLGRTGRIAWTTASGTTVCRAQQAKL